MAWNLTYDHLLRWIVADASRTAAFQASIAGRVGPRKAAGITFTDRESFEELKEGESLDICGNAGLFPSANIKEILDMQLTKRNLAPHAILQEIGAAQADGAITSLVQNVVLVLK